MSGIASRIARLVASLARSASCACVRAIAIATWRDTKIRIVLSSSL